MTSPVPLLLIATLLPLAGFLLIFFIGRKMEMPLAGWVASGLSIASFGATLLAMVRWFEEMHGVETWGFRVRPILRTVAWLPTAAPGYRSSGFMELGIYIDSLTIAMFATATLISAIVHVFSIGFMRREQDFHRYFACLSLSSFAILGAVLSGTLVQILAMWGLVGVTTALLVGFRREHSPNSNAGVKAFIFQRIGDAAMLIGFGLLYSKLGNVTLPSLISVLGDAAGGHAVVLPDGNLLSLPFVTSAGLCLFCGAAAHGAQFPFHSSLAGASKQLIPGGALICSVTTSAASIYLVARLFPILTPNARLMIAIIGLTTLTMAALISLVQRDLARLLTWTTISQIGYMVLAIGVGSWVGALFHLITTAFTLSLLFLAAASVVHANGGMRDMQNLAGGWRKLPVTASAFALAALAMAGAPFLARYYSQSMIASDAAAFAIYAVAAAGRSRGYWLFSALPIAMAYVTALAMGRCWMLTFFARPPQAQSLPPVREHASLWVPMLVLVMPAVIAGYAMNVPEMLNASMLETRAMCDEILDAAHPQRPTRFTSFDQTWPAVPAAAPAPDASAEEDAKPLASPASHASDKGHLLQHKWLAWSWLAGIGVAIVLYREGDGFATRIFRRQPVRFVHAWLYNEMYFDELVDWTFVRGILVIAIACDVFDRHVLDGLIKYFWRILRFRARQGPS